MQAVSNAVDSRFAADLAARYIVEREIGRGGSAVVYLARDRKIGRQVALKVLGPVAGAAEAARRFEREIAMVGRLQHPNILALYDSGEAGGALYFAMPYVEGWTLRARLTREGALPPSDALRIAAELADALAYAHAAGVVHRDVKPENVLLSGYPGPPRAAGPGNGRWHVLVCDFGIARWTERDGPTPVADRSGERRLFIQVTRAGHTVGTPAYMAPEQVTADPRADRRADVWSLGVVLYEMLTGSAAARRCADGRRGVPPSVEHADAAARRSRWVAGGGCTRGRRGVEAGARAGSGRAVCERGCVWCGRAGGCGVAHGGPDGARRRPNARADRGAGSRDRRDRGRSRRSRRVV